MFLVWKEYGRVDVDGPERGSYRVQLVASRREGGKVRQHIIRHLVSYHEYKLHYGSGWEQDRERERVWGAIIEGMAREKLTPEQQQKFMNQIIERIPPPLSLRIAWAKSAPPRV